MNDLEKECVQELQMTPVIPSVEEPTLYDIHIKENFQIFGFGSILYACLYTFCMYKNDAGITYPLLVVGSLGFIHFCMKKLEMKWKKESLFYIVSMILLSISTFCTDDFRIIFFNKIGVFLLTICMVLGIVYDTKKWEFTKFFCSILKTLILAIGEIGRPFSDAAWFCKNKMDKKNTKYLYMLIGVGVAIPIVIVIFALLSSADVVFRDLGDRLLSKIDAGDAFGVGFMFITVFLAAYCILTYISKKKLKEEIEDTRKWEPLLAIPVTSVLSLMYLVFSGIQIIYLFLGNMQLPEGYTYAEYAREGFFQLLTVSMINLVIVLIGLYFFKSSKVLKLVLTIMSLCTFIMIASSALRMIIYIQYYYLTFLRIFVLWSLVVLFLLFVGVIGYIVKKDFPLFRYSMVVVTSLYIALSFSHPDYWIAKVNLESTKETRNEFFKGEPYKDFGLLGNLNADAAPVMVKWIGEEGYSLDSYYIEDMTFDAYRILNGNVGNHVDSKEWCAYYYLKELNENCRYVDFGRNFNVSRFLAGFEVLFQDTKGM
ncbi:MAG: DUF4173 domain-containing protein [Agathobacter sp.]|nr:DUF4173 domain-containing protein [Agathobacter sp.]